MKVYRDTTTIILNFNRIVLADGNLDIGTVSSEGLVDRVIYDLVDQVVQSLLTDVTDVHGSALTYGL